MNALNSSTTANDSQIKVSAKSLSRLYFIRAAFSIVWVILVFAFAKNNPVFTSILFVIYPVWDAIATFIDIKIDLTGTSKTPQYVNLGISLITTIAVILALQKSIPDALIVFGIWAILTGLIQLLLALRRRKQQLGGQWPMIISGGQSMLGGSSFILLAHAPTSGINSLAGYAAFGAFYFILAGIRLTKASKQPAVTV